MEIKLKLKKYIRNKIYKALELIEQVAKEFHQEQQVETEFVLEPGEINKPIVVFSPKGAIHMTYRLDSDDPLDIDIDEDFLESHSKEEIEQELIDCYMNLSDTVGSVIQDAENGECSHNSKDEVFH